MALAQRSVPCNRPFTIVPNNAVPQCVLGGPFGLKPRTRFPDLTGLCYRYSKLLVIRAMARRGEVSDLLCRVWVSARKARISLCTLL